MWLFVSWLAIAATAAPALPEENLAKGQTPDVSGAEEGARSLVDAIIKDDPAAATGYFFPVAPFEQLKDAASPRRYHQKLLGFFAEDIHAEHKRFAKLKSGWILERVELGRCKWKAPGTEANKLAYWSCMGNRLVVKAGERRRTIDVQVLINWGPRWYVTHLGPIRK